MTYSDLEENKESIKIIMSDIKWVDDLTEITIDKGIYFFKKLNLVT
ncbi:hypothetical protein [Enterococcus rivorum]|nr:hypothetical protein [Enterococcus rivorum]MBP2100480.1 hypothetical protein [Enterococcus rivorum]